MIKLISLSLFVKDIVLTSIASLFTGVGTIIGIHFLTQGLGPEGFGAYSLSKQVLAIVSPISTLAMGTAIARYTAISTTDNGRYGYLFSGLLLGVIPASVILIASLSFRVQLTNIIYRDEGYLSIFLATLFGVLGHSFYAILYAYYRGIGKMGRANIWQFAVVGAGPLIIAITFAKTGRVDLILILMGLLSYSTCVPLLLFKFRYTKDPPKKTGWQMKNKLCELFRYALPRIPGGFALAGILAVGPLTAPYFYSLKEAGYLVVGQSFFGFVEGGVAAFGLVVLPKVAYMLSSGNRAFLKERITDIVVFITHIGLFVTPHLLLWSDQIILLWLGEKYSEATQLVRVFVLALVPYLYYIMLRSIIDAVEFKAVNTYNLLIALSITVVISLSLVESGMNTTGLAMGTAVGLFVLGSLTVRYLRRENWMNTLTLHLVKCIALNIVFIAIAAWVKYVLQVQISAIALFFTAVLLEGFLFFFYIWMLWRTGIGWTLELERRVIRLS